MAKTSVSISDYPQLQSWQRRERPLRLERRLEFPSYMAARTFLDDAAALSEETGIYPDLNFGRTYVNLTLFADEESSELTPELTAFARRLDALVGESQEESP
jgi:4a-hydroxytetrahydrobiopterin dehydratase